MVAGDWQRRLQQWQDDGVLADILPEVAALNGVMQPPEYHAEGDALVHTMLAVTAVSAQSDERVFWAVLLHDIGKKKTTHFVEGRWKSHGHARSGAAMVPDILSRLNLTSLAADVAWFVKHHHFALDWGDSIKTGLTRHQRKFCSLSLFPLLVEVCRADAVASLGGSQKGPQLERILACCENEVGGG